MLGINASQCFTINIKLWVVGWIHFLKKMNDEDKCLFAFLNVLGIIWITRNELIFRGGCPNLRNIMIQLNYCTSLTIRGRETRLQEASWPRELTLIGIDVDDRIRIKNSYHFFLIDREESCGMLQVKVDVAWTYDRKATARWVAYDSEDQEP